MDFVPYATENVAVSDLLLTYKYDDGFVKCVSSSGKNVEESHRICIQISGEILFWGIYHVTGSSVLIYKCQVSVVKIK